MTAGGRRELPQDQRRILVEPSPGAPGRWSVPVYAENEPKQRVVALVWAADSLFAAGAEGGLVEFSAAEGKVVARTPLDAPVWDGMAAADGRLFVSTQSGDVVCLGKK